MRPRILRSLSMPMINLVVELRVQGISWPLLGPLGRALLLIDLLNLLTQLLLHRYDYQLNYLQQ
jgi:hypothetical protein